MQPEEIGRQLAARGIYAAEWDDGILLVRDLDCGSEYIMEPFADSLQIRQAVWLDCHDLPADALNRIHLLCSMMNERFSGCKSCVDQWGALITAADILGPGIAVEFVETMLNQVEFMSAAMLDLVEIIERDQRLVTDKDIDAALEVSPLH